MTRRWLRRLSTLLVGLALLGGAAWGLLLLMLPGAIVHAPNAGRAIPAEDDPPPAIVARLGAREHLRVRVGPPAASLSCLLLDPPRGVPPAGTLLVLHGIRDRKEPLLGTGQRWATAGYRVLLVDLRGHGRSSGEHLSYGVHEARDLSQVLDALEARRLLAPPVAALGFSYGGAVAIQLAGRDPRVAAVVSVSTFASLRRIVPDYVARLVPLLGRLVPGSQIQAAVDRAGRTGGFDPDQASPLRSLASAKARVLIVHGSRDVHVPPEHGRDLARAAGARGRLLLVEGADHNTIMQDGSGIVRRESERFLRAGSSR